MPFQNEFQQCETPNSYGYFWNYMPTQAETFKVVRCDNLTIRLNIITGESWILNHGNKITWKKIEEDEE